MKVKMTAEEKAAWLDKTKGSSIIEKVGINDKGNAIVVQDAGGGDRPHMRSGTVRVVEMTAGQELSSIKSKHVVSSKVIGRYEVEMRRGNENLPEISALREKASQYAHDVMAGKQKMPQSLSL